MSQTNRRPWIVRRIGGPVLATYAHAAGALSRAEALIQTRYPVMIAHRDTGRTYSPAELREAINRGL